MSSESLAISLFEKLLSLPIYIMSGIFLSSTTVCFLKLLKLELLIELYDPWLFSRAWTDDPSLSLLSELSD